jgi:hypothetical protein
MICGLPSGDDVALVERTGPRTTSVREVPDEAERLTERILGIGVVLAIAGAAVQTASQLLNYFVFDFEVWNLNVDADNNAFAWASSVAQFAAAFCCALLVLAGWWSARRLLALTLILAFFSLDDVARYHEDLAFSFREDVLGVQLAYGRIIWPIMFFPLLAGAFVLLWRFSEQAEARPARFVRIGLVLLVAAIFAEAASTVFHVGDDPEGTLQDILQVALEESLELVAWVLIAAAAAATLCSTLVERGRATS